MNSPSKADDETLSTSRSFSPVLVWIVAIGAAALVLYLLTSQPMEAGVQHPAVGRPLPTVAFEPLSGGSSALTGEDLRGKTVVMNFWGPWCHFCHLQSPGLLALKADLSDEEDFLFVSVSCTATGIDDVAQLKQDTIEYFDRYKIENPPPAHLDPMAQTRRLLMQVAELPGFGYPTTVVLDKNGVIRGLWQGYQRGTNTEIRQTVLQLLDEKT